MPQSIREFGRFEVREILLVQSRLTPSGSIYTTVGTSALAAPGPPARQGPGECPPPFL